MRNLRHVTITGADDCTDIQELLDLSREFPFVEWGILVSKKQAASPRFPSRLWIKRFADAMVGTGLKVSTHVCGEWVRKMLIGALDWKDLPEVIDVSQRVQINTHAEPHLSTASMMETLWAMGHKEFIFQRDGVNDHLAYAALGYGLKASTLFDTSHGAGVLPDGWPAPPVGLPVGYAGGLGPNNVVDQIRRIGMVCSLPYWIDMERRVRSDDDIRLDMKKVRQVLASVEEFVAR